MVELMKGLQSCLLVALAMASACVVSWGQDKNVPQKALWEIQRRGNLVEVIDGNHRADAATVKAAMMGIPADDSNKFQLTIVVAADKTCGPCEQLKKDLASPTPALAKFLEMEKRPDGLLQSSDNSYLHVSLVPYTTAFRPEHFANIKITTLPTLILQPSLDGKKGDPTIVINQRGGRLPPDELAKWIGSSLDAYVNSTFAKNGFQEAGGPPAPFPFPSPQPGPNGPTFDLVPVLQPKALTAAELKAIVPDASSEFLFELLASGVSNAEQVRSAWLMRVQKEKAELSVKKVDELASECGSLREKLKGVEGLPDRVKGLVADREELLAKLKELSERPPLSMSWFATLLGIALASPLFWKVATNVAGRIVRYTANTPNKLDDEAALLLQELVKERADKLKAKS